MKQFTGLEASSNIIVILEANRFISWVNQSFEALSGYTLEEIKGKDVKMLLSEQNDPQLICQAKACLLKHCEWQGEIIVRRKDGHEFVDKVSITPILTNNGTTACFLVVNSTERITEQEVIAAAQEVKMKAEKISPYGTIPARISHDLNQPLNSIKMISGGILYLLRQGKKLPDEELAECMKEISCQTDRLAGIIKNLKM